jgi:diaminopropionate ammonia-lyase
MPRTSQSALAREFGSLWKEYRPTSLIESPVLAERAKVARVLLKLEAERPLGNFKVLGGMIAGLRALARCQAASADGRLPHLICASDGNHGLAVAAAAARAGTRALIYLPSSAKSARARRIELVGGQVIRVDGTYDAAVLAAAEAATRGQGVLVPDTGPDPHDPVLKDVMAGYALLGEELLGQFRDQAATLPTHVFVQAGVGGLAAAIADALRGVMQSPKSVVVVEPEGAACVTRGLAAGRPVAIEGELETAAEMLSCGLASARALLTLCRHGARSVLVSEPELIEAVRVLHETDRIDTTASGAAGLAGLRHVSASGALRRQHQLDFSSHVLLVITEGAMDRQDSHDLGIQ